MGAHIPSLRGDPHDGPDLTGGPSLDQMTLWLDSAEHEGPDGYLNLWERLVASVGGSAGFMWQDVFPILLIGNAEDAQGDIRRTLVDGLAAHLSHSRFRQQLVQRLVDRTTDGGTNPKKSTEEVALATMRAIADFLATEGRILIDPSNKLTEGAGLPHSWGKQGDDHDEEILRAGRVYFSAIACPRPCMQITGFVERFGRRTENGWIELAADAPFFTDGETAFAAWRRALTTINASDPDDDCPEEWAIFDAAEQVLIGLKATGPRIAEMRLWIGLQHELTTHAHHELLQNDDLPGLIAAKDDLGWPAWPMIQAIVALREASESRNA